MRPSYLAPSMSLLHPPRIRAAAALATLCVALVPAGFAVAEEPVPAPEPPAPTPEPTPADPGIPPIVPPIVIAPAPEAPPPDPPPPEQPAPAAPAAPAPAPPTTPASPAAPAAPAAPTAPATSPSTPPAATTAPLDPAAEGALSGLLVRPGLLRPTAGRTLHNRRPLLRWRGGPAAIRLYNVQVFAGKRKVVSAFPRGTSLKVRIRLRPGTTYVWRVWPFLKGGGYTREPLAVSYFRTPVVKRASPAG